MRRINKTLSYFFLIGITAGLICLSIMLINILVEHQIKSSHNFNRHTTTEYPLADALKVLDSDLLTP